MACRLSFQPGIGDVRRLALLVAGSASGGFQRWPEASACYRLDTSGVGGEKDRDYRPQYLAFLRVALPVLSDAQLIHLHYASRALSNAHAELDNTHAKLDSTRAERDIEVAASATLQRRVTALESSCVYRLYPLEQRSLAPKKRSNKKWHL